MTKEEFKQLTGESPEDMFGADWEAILEDYNAHEWKPTIASKEEEECPECNLSENECECV